MNEIKSKECVVNLRAMLSEQKFLSDDDEELNGKSTLEVIRIMKRRHGDNWINQMTIMKLDGMTPIARGHFVFGMKIRNWMSASGYGVRELEVVNLDDVYVGLLEAACVGEQNETN